MAQQKLYELMEKAILEEAKAVFIYFYQSIELSGIKGHSVKNELFKTSREEMEHIEQISHRLNQLGIPIPRKLLELGDRLDSFLDNFELNISLEEGAIKLYKEIIKVSGELNDITTQNIFINILEQEENHLNFFQKVFDGEMQRFEKK